MHARRQLQKPRVLAFAVESDMCRKLVGWYHDKSNAEVF